MTIFVGRNESWVVPVGWATTRISCILTSCGNLKDSACANTKVHLKFRHNTQMSSFSPTLKLKIMFWYVLMQWIEGESRGNHGFYNIWVPPGFSLQSIHSKHPMLQNLFLKNKSTMFLGILPVEPFKIPSIPSFCNTGWKRFPVHYGLCR